MWVGLHKWSFKSTRRNIGDVSLAGTAGALLHMSIDGYVRCILNVDSQQQVTATTGHNEAGETVPAPLPHSI
jgi:hypothetical protein